MASLSTSWRHLKSTESEFSVRRTQLMEVKEAMATRQTEEMEHTQAAGEYLWSGCTEFTAQSRNEGV